MKNITRIVLTGGPCSGKSTFIDMAADYFSNRGYYVFVDHEAATDLITGGISPMSLGMYSFQKYVISLQLAKEKLFIEAAQEVDADNILIFYDRGIFDDKGYVSDQEFDEIISDFELSDEEIINQYDVVLHLTTTAKGNHQDFSSANNNARYEDVKEAVRVDDMILESWSCHPTRLIIKDEDDFQLKLTNALEELKRFLAK